ncbi:hypothetical protein Tco_1399077 [Tanacetum coccineum]
MPYFYQTEGRKKFKTSETTSGSASDGLNLNEEADETVEETQEFRPMGRDRAKAKKKASGSSRGRSSFIDLLIVMDHKKGSSSSSFTENLFGPKDATPASSSGLFSSVFGPSSTINTESQLKYTVLKALDNTLEFIMFSYNIGYLKQVVHSSGFHKVLEETRRPTLRTQEHANSTNTEVHMEVATNQHQNTRDKGAWAKRKGIPCTKMKQQQNQAISVRLSIMVAKKFILQIPKLLALTIP